MGREGEGCIVNRWIRTNRLKLFGHIVRADPSTDHSRAFASCHSLAVASLPRDGRSDQPHQTWLRTVESDLAPLNIGLATANHRAQNRQAWSTLVGMATSFRQAT